MDNRRLGITIVIISMLLLPVILGFNYQLTKASKDSCGCNACESGNVCKENKFSFLLTGGLALVFGILSLGIYLLFFEKSYQILIQRLEKEKNKLSKDEKFNLVLLGLNEDERKIMTAVKDQDGITQQTLKIRIDMHKSKLSVLVGILEKKGLIKKIKKGKINQLFLRPNLK